MTHDQRQDVILCTLCGTLALATVGILVLMARGTNVALPATLAVAAGWHALAKKLK